MIKSLKKFFTPSAKGVAEPARDISLAVAALLVEVMRIDDILEEAEQNSILIALERRFGLGHAAIHALIEEARQEAADAHDLHQFTSQIKAHYPVEARIDIVTELWQVAMVDGHVDPHEEHLIRRAADLLGIYHNEFIRAKIAARTPGT